MIKNKNGKTYINVTLFNRKMMENRMNFSNIMEVLQVNSTDRVDENVWQCGVEKRRNCKNSKNNGSDHGRNL